MKSHIAIFSCWLWALALITGCASIYTQPMHDPIYPSSSQSVTYTIETNSDDGIKNVKLYETVSTVNSSGVVTAGTTSLLKEWSPAGSPNSFSGNHLRSGGYGSNRLITYKFEVKNGRNKVRSHEVTYATRPYPVTDSAAPIYVQGDIDDVFDVVLIPDTDITNMNTFRSHARGVILNTIYREPTMELFCKQFNFYINPYAGTATDYDRIAIDGYHTPPSNMANLSFAEVKALMHQGNLRDYSYGDIFSTEMQNYQTFIHENGHAMFSLADEYPGGAHWQETILPNNWSSLSGAQSDAPSRHKTASDATQMGSTGWYKICDSTCPMISGGALLFDFERPCDDRVIYSILDNAIN